MFNELKIDEANSLIRKIEKQCLESDNDTIIAQFLCFKGWGLFHTESYEECIPYLKQACILFEKINNRYQDYIDCYFYLSIAYQKTNNYAEAERYCRKAIISCHSPNIPNVTNRTNSLYIFLANIYHLQGDTLMERITDDAIKMRNDYGVLKNSVWDSINKYRNIKEYDKSVYYLSALSSLIKDWEGITEEYIVAEYSRGLDLRMQGNYSEAKNVFESIIYHRAQLALFDKNVCGAYCNYCMCLAMEGKYGQIDKIIHEAVSYIKYTDDESYTVPMLYRFIGNGAYNTQDYTNAIKYYTEYLNPKHLRESGDSYDEITYMLSNAYILSGLQNDAIQLLNTYLKANEKKLESTGKPLLSLIYNNLGIALAINKENKKALRYLNKSKVLQIELYGNVADITQKFLNECSK